MFTLLNIANLQRGTNSSVRANPIKRWQADTCVVSEGRSHQYQVFLQVDAAQEAESLEAGETGDSV